MFVNNIKTNLCKNSFDRYHKQCYSDNDEDCSCSSCECSSISDENIRINNNAISFQSINMSAKQNTQRQSEDENYENKKQELSTIDLEHIYQIIDQSYTKIPILYNSIKQTKLDTDFILSVNNYLDRLKSNIYKDLIRRETLLRNGKNHTRNLISLIRCICKISYEQANEIPDKSISSKHAILYTMTAIDYILQNNFPQNKPLFNYILNEYISMWLHENLRIIQEDFCIIAENGRKKNFFSLCICIFNKLESICAINWERLQMIQNYRLTHFDQLLKPTSMKLEINKDFILLFGKSLKLTMKISDIPITSLYSNRTDNELSNIDEIHYIFRKSIAKILQNNFIGEDLHSQQRITPSIEITTPTSILEKSTWNIISETQIQSIKPIVSPCHLSSSTNQLVGSSPSDMLEKRQSGSKLVALEHRQLSVSIEMIPNPNISNSIHGYQSHSQTLTKTKSDTSLLIKTIEPINSFNEPISTLTSINLLPQSSSNILTPIIPIKSESQKSNSPLKFQNEDKSSINLSTTDSPPPNLTVTSPQKPFTDDHLSPSSHKTPSNKSITTDSKAVLNAEVNALINFLTELADSSSSVQQSKETSPLVEQLESCLKENNTNPNLIIQKLRTVHPQSSFSVKDPLFLAEFTRVLRKELEDAQILREIDCGQLNEDSQNIGYLSFETRNILKLPEKKDTAAGDNIDQNRIFIEVTHDPSRCTPNHEHSCTSSPQKHPQFNHNSSPKSVNSKSKDTAFMSSKSNNQQSSLLESNHSQQRWYWIRSDENSLSKDCLITPNSLFCTRKSFDKNTYSITVEHNEEFQ